MEDETEESHKPVISYHITLAQDNQIRDDNERKNPQTEEKDGQQGQIRTEGLKWNRGNNIDV